MTTNPPGMSCIVRWSCYDDTVWEMSQLNLRSSVIKQSTLAVTGKMTGEIMTLLYGDLSTSVLTLGRLH